LKKVGVGLILAGLAVMLLYAVYTVITSPDMFFILRLGIIGIFVGIFVLITGLIIERKRDREAEDDDTGKY